MDPAPEQLTDTIIQSQSATANCSPQCQHPDNDPEKDVVCAFCQIGYHLQCAGLRKQPPKSKVWICQPCRKLPKLLQDTIERLNNALKEIEELKTLNRHERKKHDLQEIPESRQGLEETLEESYSSIVQKQPQQEQRHNLLIGDSILRDFNNGTFENTTVRCIRGASVESIRMDLTDEIDLEKIQNLIIHVGTNDVSSGSDVTEILEKFEDMITTLQVATPKTENGPFITVSGPCPRLDAYSPEIEELDNKLNELMLKLDCRYIANSLSFKYADGRIDRSMYSDDVHLNRKGAERLAERLTAIPSIYRQTLVNKATPEDQIHSNPQPSKYRSPRVKYPRRNHVGPDRNSHPRLNARSYQPPNFRRPTTRHEPMMPLIRQRPPYHYQNHYRDKTSYNDHDQHHTPSARRGCYNCGEHNHNMRTCRHQQPLQCRVCSRYGHKERYCYFR